VDAKKPVPPIAAGAPRPQPAVAPVGALAFPAVEHARLSNGMAVDLARRTAVPKVLVSLGFDAGVAADAVDAPGTQGLLLAMLQEGTAGAHPRDATQVLEEQERLGATISAGAVPPCPAQGRGMASTCVIPSPAKYPARPAASCRRHDSRNRHGGPRR